MKPHYSIRTCGRRNINLKARVTDAHVQHSRFLTVVTLPLRHPEAGTCPKVRRMEHTIWKVEFFEEENAVRVLLLRYVFSSSVTPPPPPASFRNSLMKRKGPQNVVPDMLYKIRGYVVVGVVKNKRMIRGPMQRGPLAVFQVDREGERGRERARERERATARARASEREVERERERERLTDTQPNSLSFVYVVCVCVYVCVCVRLGKRCYQVCEFVCESLCV